MLCRNGHVRTNNKRGECIECAREKTRRYHHRNKDARNAASREYLPAWREKNKEKMKRDNADWRSKNRERHVQNSVEWRRKNWTRIYAERLSDPQKRLRSTLSSAICIQLRAGGTKKETAVTNLLGCSIPEFMRHVERQWLCGMSWKNWGRKIGCWQLDHMRPVSSFDLTIEAQKFECFNFKNYQPLWMVDNLAKRARDPIDFALANGRLV